MLGVLPHFQRRPLPRGLSLVLALLLALAPAVYVAIRVAASARNVAYWDEFDTVLALVLQLDSGQSLGETLSRLFAVSNEHRMFTSRLLFAASYWLTGGVNFTVICAIGNAFILAACGLLWWSAGATPRRIRLLLPLALLLFQFEHYENFLWSGSSIDHFQVVLLAIGALLGVARGSRTGLLIGVVCALLATFTLAHGLLVWPVGAAMLLRARRGPPLALWLAVGGAAAAAFFWGFEMNHAQRFAPFSLAGAAVVLRYWLVLLGYVPALGNAALAPWLGALLLLALAAAAARGALRREPALLPIAVFAVAALALIAVGRAAESGGAVHSRYLVLGALAWALTLFFWIERTTHPRRPFAVVVAVVPLLALFNVAANRAFDAKVDSWVECRDRAALRFKQHGVDGRGPFRLFPAPARSTALLHEAERRGIYRMAPICLPRAFPAARLTSRIAYWIDEMSADPRAVSLAGWAAIPGVAAERGRVYVVLRSGREMHIFSTVTIARPDVVQATRETAWELCGFRFVKLRESLPTGDFQVGILIDGDDGPEFIMTAHRLRLVGPGEALLATAE